jgi:lactate dehydrogenase-like 2-hydroxyacid dehydrogenase
MSLHAGLRPRLVVSQDMPPAVVSRLAERTDCWPLPAVRMTAETLLDACLRHRPDALMITGGTRLDAGTIAALPDSVRMVATVSVGFDHVDLAALQARGLPLTNTPDVLTDCNADLTFMLILGACRRATEYAAVIRDGWGRPLGMTELLGTRVSGKTLGIIGMGRIGRAVARRARGFDMQVLYCNRTRLAPELEQGATFVAELDRMLPRCDILSLHLPASPATEGLIDARMLALLPKGAVLVNAARGSLVVEDALFAALESGRLAGAGLDVYRNEPAIDPRFASHPRLFLTPHMGSATLETRTAMGLRALDNVEAALSGGAPPDLVMPQQSAGR